MVVSRSKLVEDPVHLEVPETDHNSPETSPSSTLNAVIHNQAFFQVQGPHHAWDMRRVPPSLSLLTLEWLLEKAA